MLAEYSDFGGFTTEEGTLDNINTMTKYLLETNPFSDFSTNAEAFQDQQRMGVTMFEEHQMRVWRVLNLCNAVRMGYSGQGLASSKMDMEIVAFRANATKDYNADNIETVMSRIGDIQWWTVVKTELKAQAKMDPLSFNRTQENLLLRWNNAYRKAGKNALHTRSELHRYLEAMDETVQWMKH